MRNIQETDSSAQKCSETSREDASSSLRNRARDLRDQAHNLEKLADQVRGISGPAEEALWRLINCSR